jgi:hypothetical protein
MTTTKNILIFITMLFTVVTAFLLLLAVFEVTDSNETQDSIIKLAKASGIIAIAAAVVFGLSSISAKK